MALIGTPPCDKAAILSGAGTQVDAATGRWVLAATILGSSLAFIDGTVVNVALPSLQASFAATLAQVQWVVESYALTLAALMLTGGALGDLFGRRIVFALGVLLFAMASIWCGVSRTIAELIVARGVQGVGAALLVPGSLALISASFAPDERGRAIGTWSGATAITAALGPVLGGWLIEHLSWRYVFFLNIPIACVVLAISLWRVPETRGSGTDSEATPWQRLDLAGVLLTMAGLGGLTFGIIESVPGATIGGAVLLVVFAIVEYRSRAPMLPLSLFRSATFSGANLLTLFLYAALSGMFFFLPLNLIQVQGYSATAAGSAMLPFIVLMSLLSRWSGGLVGRYGPRRPLIVGPLVAAAGFALLARPVVGGSYWATVFPGVVVLGFGMTISVAPLTTTVMNAVAAGRSGIASGVNNATSRVAGVFAIAVFGAILSAGFNSELDRQFSEHGVTPQVRADIDAQRRSLGAARTGDAAGQEAIRTAFVHGYRNVLSICVLLAVASSASAAIFIRPGSQSTR